MGLDITVYSNVVPFDEKNIPLDSDGEMDWDYIYDHGIRKAFAFPGMEQSLRPLTQDSWVQASGESWSFRAGSYSGYNWFRDHLSTMALGVDSGTVWANPDTYRDQPFFELINFADNEGTIGGEAARDLHEDFTNFLAQATTYFTGLPDGDFALEKYQTWLSATEDASVSGMIDFH